MQNVVAVTQETVMEEIFISPSNEIITNRYATDEETAAAPCRENCSGQCGVSL